MAEQKTQRTGPNPTGPARIQDRTASPTSPVGGTAASTPSTRSSTSKKRSDAAKKAARTRKRKSSGKNVWDKASGLRDDIHKLGEEAVEKQEPELAAFLRLLRQQFDAGPYTETKAEATNRKIERAYEQIDLAERAEVRRKARAEVR
jgi:hypothetical protein